MNKEIKEILDFIKEQIEKETLSYEPDVELSKEEAKLLLDNITNLQEENEELKTENEKLTQLWLDSQEKRRKAIEYIKENSAFMNDDEWEVFNKKDLLNILKGDKDE